MKRKRYIKLMMSKYPSRGRNAMEDCASAVRIMDSFRAPYINVDGSELNSRGYDFWWAYENTVRAEDAASIAVAARPTGFSR